MRIPYAFVLLLALFPLAATACGSSASDLCDVSCDCEACSDRGYDECTIEEQYRIDEADIYGCEDLYLEYQDCAIQRYSCNNGRFDVPDNQCGPERQRWHECIGDGSALH